MAQRTLMRALAGSVRKWTAAEKRLVGSMPDNKLAKRLGRRYQSVVRMRHLLGRPLCRSPHPTGWKPWQVQLLGVLPDREVARRLRRSLASVQLRRHVKGGPPPPPATQPRSPDRERAGSGK